MTPTTFDTEFQRLTTEMVEIAFEYIGRNKEEVEGIYICGSMENDMYSYNVFYQINKTKVKKQDVNNFLTQKVDTSSQMQHSLMGTGNEMLLDLSDVFINANREVPTLLKMVYHPQTGSFDCDIIYEPQYSNHPEWTDADVFENWYNQEKES